MAFTVWMGDEGMRNGRRGEEEQRRAFAVLAVVEIHPRRAAGHVVDLEEAVVAVHRHVAAEKVGELAQRLVVDVLIGISLVVDPADIDVRNGLVFPHGSGSPACSGSLA
ncbi:hypothetical protein D3C72_2085470 [compost metagenome]